jgi:EmrB/QacA subfamily drug resistance transporter
MLKAPCDDLSAEAVPKAEKPCSPVWVLLATILGSSMVFIDGSVVSIALPVMQRDLHASAAQALWIVEAYTLVLGALMLLGGAAADRIGRDRVFVAGIFVFIAGSVWCGIAQDINTAIAARVLQGFGGVLVAPASLAIIGALFSGANRDKAVGTWTAFTALTSLVSPVAGGALVTAFGWRAVFYINVPLGLFTAYAAIAHIPETRDEERQGRPDILGSALIGCSLGCIVYALTAISGGSISAAVLAGAGVAGIALLALFVYVESRAEQPIMPLNLFRSRVFTGVNVETLLLYGGLYAIFYFLPFDLIQAHGYSPFLAGAAMLPFVICMSLISRQSAAMMEKTGPRVLLSAGPALVAVGFALFALLPRQNFWWGILPPMLIVGIGMGIVVAPLTGTVMNAVPAHNVGLAAGVNNALSRIGGLLAIAIAGALLWGLFNARMQAQLDAGHATAAQRAAVARQRSQLAGAHYADPRLRRMVAKSYDDSFAGIALLSAGLSLAGAAAGFVLLRGNNRG